MHTCGFEENNLAETMWDFITGSPSIGTTHKHSGTYAMRINPSAATQGVTRDIQTSINVATTWFLRFYVRIVTAPDALITIQHIFSSSGGMANRLRLSTGRQLDIFNVITSTSVTGPTLSVDTWYRIETRYLMADSGGQIEVRVYNGDETTPISTFGIGNFTGGNGTDEDTQANTGARWGWGALTTNSSCDLWFDDIALNNENGSTQNSWCGPGKIALLVPNTEVSIAFTPNTGTDNSANADDLPGTPDDDTTYNSHSTANGEDRLGLTALPAEVPSDATMLLAVAMMRVRGEGTTGTRTCRVLLWDEGGTQTNGPTTGLIDGTTYGLMGTGQILTLDLTGKTKANVDAFDAGYEPLSNHPMRVTALWVEIEWLEAGAQTIDVNQATETDTAQAIAKRKIKGIGQSTETDTAQAIAKVKRKAIGQSVETGSAQAITSRKIKAIGQAIETDTAQAITPEGDQVIAVGQAVESDTLQVIAPRKIRAIAQAVEADLAQAFTSLKRKAIGQAVEANTAFAITVKKAVTVATAIETDTAQAIAWAPKYRLIGQAVETDTALTITPEGVVPPFTSLNGKVPVRYITDGSIRNVVPVETVTVNDIGVVPVIEQVGPANVVPVREVTTETPRVKVIKSS